MKYITVLLLSLIYMSCSSDPLPGLEENIMVVHDEVMPKMSELTKYQMEIRKVIEKDTNNSAALELLSKIHSADSAMWTWMAQYQSIDKMTDLGKSKDEMKDYLSSEITRVELMANSIYESIEEGKAFMDSQGLN